MNCALNEWKGISEKSRTGIIWSSYEIMSILQRCGSIIMGPGEPWNPEREFWVNVMEVEAIEGF